MTGKIVLMAAITVLTAAAPLGIMMWLHWKKSARWLPFLIGMVFFPLFAIGLEQVFHWIILRTALGGIIQGNIWLYALYGGLAAGLFEETGRFAAFKLALQDRWEPVTAISYGLGHGGIEAFVLVGLTMIANLSLVLAYGSGKLAPETAELAETLIATPAVMFFWAGFERLAAMILHVSNSVLVFACVWEDRRALFPAAILIHAAVDFIAVACGSFLPVAVVEILVMACSAAAAVLAAGAYRQLGWKNAQDA